MKAIVSPEIASSSHVIELTEGDLESVAAGGWFKKLTGISTPSILKRLDDKVRENVPGGWLGVIGKILSK